MQDIELSRERLNVAQDKAEAVVQRMLQGSSELAATQVRNGERLQDISANIVTVLQAVQQQEIGGLISSLQNMEMQLVKLIIHSTRKPG